MFTAANSMAHWCGCLSTKSHKLLDTEHKLIWVSSSKEAP
jgi:hypothetical protein